MCTRVQCRKMRPKANRLAAAPPASLNWKMRPKANHLAVAPPASLRFTEGEKFHAVVGTPRGYPLGGPIYSLN